MSNNRGFTLVEILASIVILGILATVFFQFFIFSQKTTTGNQEKLITLNVAQGVLEQIKYGNYPEVTNPENHDSIDYPEEYQGTTCPSDDENCKDRYEMTINNSLYKIKVTVKQEKELGLHPVKVLVTSLDGKTESSVEGFVEICSNE